MAPPKKTKLKRHDTSPFRATLKDGAYAAVNLTGATVRFHLRSVDDDVLVVEADAVVVSGAAGTVRYDWTAADVDRVGDHLAEFQVTYSDGAVETFPSDGYHRIEFLEDLDESLD